MTVNRGKIHKYLVITIDYTTKGLCKIAVFNYINEILGTFDKIYPKENVTKSIADPNNLFVVRDDFTKLETKNNEQFHKVVVKVLFSANRASTDTGTAISYLTMRVR